MNKIFFKERLKELRIERGLSQEQLAKKLGTYQVNIARWESGENHPSLNTIIEIAVLFGVTSDFLLGLQDEFGDIERDYLTELNDFEAEPDERVKQVLDKLGLSRMVLDFARKCYKTWTQDWNFSDEMLDYAMELSRDKANPLAYMNAILSAWKDKGIRTIEKIKQQHQTSFYDMGTPNLTPREKKFLDEIKELDERYDPQLLAYIDGLKTTIKRK